MGTDPTRDWKTLLKAFGNDDRFEIVGVSKRLTDKMVSKFSNIRVQKNPSMEEFRTLYRWTDYAIITLIRNLYSGITIALEATSMGVPVVCSATGGVPTYFSSEEVLYVEPENPAALRDAVLKCTQPERRALVQNAQARFLREDYSSKGMAGRHVKLSQEILQADDFPASGSAASTN